MKRTLVAFLALLCTLAFLAPSTSAAISSAEREAASLVNTLRAQNGLSALTLDEALCDAARLKSQDMQQNRYFDHQSPTWGSPFDMMRALGFSYAYAAENIASGSASAAAVLSAWMNSPAHRANLLSTRATRLGIGYVAQGSYWTQWFLG